PSEAIDARAQAAAIGEDHGAVATLAGAELNALRDAGAPHHLAFRHLQRDAALVRRRRRIGLSPARIRLRRRACALPFRADEVGGAPRCPRELGLAARLAH